MSPPSKARSFESNDIAEIRFPESGTAVSFRLQQDAVVPRPVYLTSTISRTGVDNVAPLQLCQPRCDHSANACAENTQAC